MTATVPAAPADGDDVRPEPGGPATSPPPVAPLHWWAVTIAATAVPVALAWGSYFFADDFLFLEQARVMPLDLDYLRLDLFGHFSPFTRFANNALMSVAPGSWAVAWTVMLVLFAITAYSLQWLASGLFGRTARGLVTTVVLVLSLGLVRILQWWTASMNLLPGVIALVVALGAYVRFRVSGRARWGVLCVAAYVLGLVGYELAMILPGYLLLAEVLLVPRRAAAGAAAEDAAAEPGPPPPAEPGTWTARLEAVLGAPFPRWTRSTVVLWGSLAVLAGAAVANYSTNYYHEIPKPTAGVAASALRRSVLDTLMPATVGMYSGVVQPVAIILGGVVVWLALAAVTVRARGAWRGWLFAALGAAPPVLAVIVSRAGLYGPQVGTELYYVAIPAIFVIVGVAEAMALRLDASPATEPVVARRRTVVAAAATSVYAAAFVVSGLGIRDVEGYAASSHEFADNFRRSMERLDRTTPGDMADVSVLDTSVSPAIVPVPFFPYNRASRMTAVLTEEPRFDVVEDGPLHVVQADGTVVPAAERVLWESLPGEEAPPANVVDAVESGPSPLPAGGWCVTTGANTQLSWDLPAPVVGVGLAIRMEATVDRATGVEWTVIGDTASGRASGDEHELRPDDEGLYETIMQPQVRSLILAGLDPGRELCITKVSLLEVTPR